MKKEEMFKYMVEELEKQKGWKLNEKEVWLMERSFLMGIDYEKRTKCSTIERIVDEYKTGSANPTLMFKIAKGALVRGE